MLETQSGEILIASSGIPEHSAHIAANPFKVSFYHKPLQSVVRIFGASIMHNQIAFFKLSLAHTAPNMRPILLLPLPRAIEF